MTSSLAGTSTFKMADEQGLVSVKIHDEIDPENFGEYKEKSDEEKNIDNLGLLGSIDDDDSEEGHGNNDGDDSDTAELLSGQKKAPPFWTFEYYQTFFDVDTAQVLRRILGSMVPVRKRNYLTTQIRSNPDLYGPFWVCATLVVTIAISGNLANYLVHAGDNNWAYDFHKITFAAVAIFAYAWLVPIGVWAVLTWRGNTSGYSFLEIICVYGYSLSIFIPISILWVIPFEEIRWTLVVIGLCLSGAVLVLTFWNAVKDDDRRVAVTILIVIFLLHGSLAVGFKLYFFHSPPSVAVSTESKPMTTHAPSSLTRKAEEKQSNTVQAKATPGKNKIDTITTHKPT